MPTLAFDPSPRAEEIRDLNATDLGSVSGGNSSINIVDGVYYMDGAYLNPELAQGYLDAERRAAEAALADPAPVDPVPAPEQWLGRGGF